MNYVNYFYFYFYFCFAYLFFHFLPPSFAAFFRHGIGAHRARGCVWSGVCMQCGCGISIWLTPALTCRVPAAGSWELSRSCSNCSPLAILAVSNRSALRIRRFPLSSVRWPLSSHTLCCHLALCVYFRLHSIIHYSRPCIESLYRVEYGSIYALVQCTRVFCFGLLWLSSCPVFCI